MKKIICFILAAVIAFTIVGCMVSSNSTGTTIHAAPRNVSWSWGSYGYYHICITAGSDHVCYDIEKWYDAEEIGIEVKIKNGDHIFVCEGQYILFGQSSDCKFCK